MKWFHGLSVSGNLDRSQAMGKSGDVYLVIPAKGEGSGVVNVQLGDALVEFDAVTESGEPIPTGSKAPVLACRPPHHRLVAR